MSKTETSGMVVAAVMVAASMLPIARAEGPGALSPVALLTKASLAVGGVEVYAIGSPECLANTLSDYPVSGIRQRVGYQ